MINNVQVELCVSVVPTNCIGLPVVPYFDGLSSR